MGAGKGQLAQRQAAGAAAQFEGPQLLFWPFASSAALRAAAAVLLLVAMLSSWQVAWQAAPAQQLERGWRVKESREQQQQSLLSAQQMLAARYFAPMQGLVPTSTHELSEHFATTADGYVLRLFRLRSKAAANASAERTIVFAQHALMDSSTGWLLLGPSSLALQLADAGFDVWLANSRGNRFSRNHTSLSPGSPRFWQYSYDEMVKYDLPASLAAVRAVSGSQRKLVYLGYSQGTMIGFAALASQPAVASQVSLAIMLAPVAFTTAMTSKVFTLTARLRLDEYGLRHGWGEWGSFVQANSDAIMPVCRRWPGFCMGYLHMFAGRNPAGNVARSLVPRVFAHLPAGTSVTNMAHWAQGIRRASSRFLYAFDYGSSCAPGTSSHRPGIAASHGHAGPANASSSLGPRPSCNQEAYGQAEPPAYDMAAITTPIALFSGGRDTIATPADVALLKARLARGVLVSHMQQPDYAHLDYELGSDAPARAYPSILALAAAAAGLAPPSS